VSLSSGMGTGKGGDCCFIYYHLQHKNTHTHRSNYNLCSARRMSASSSCRGRSTPPTRSASPSHQQAAVASAAAAAWALLVRSCPPGAQPAAKSPALGSAQLSMHARACHGQSRRARTPTALRAGAAAGAAGPVVVAVVVRRLHCSSSSSQRRVAATTCAQQQRPRWRGMAGGLTSFSSSTRRMRRQSRRFDGT